jgi:hypothetical protein
MQKRFFPLWKDKEIIILVSKKFTEKDFYNNMMAIGSTLYGISDEVILKKWMEDYYGQRGS